MAKHTRLNLFLGTDFAFELEILNEAEAEAINVSGWALSFMVKRNATDLDANALVTKTTAPAGGVAISGIYNVDPDVNTQLVVVTIEDTDTDALAGGRGVWELKRTNAGLETVLAYGEMQLQRSVHHA